MTSDIVLLAIAVLLSVIGFFGVRSMFRVTRRREELARIKAPQIELNEIDEYVRLLDETDNEIDLSKLKRPQRRVED